MRHTKKTGGLEEMVEKYETAVVLADEHFDFVNEDMVRIAEKYITATKPKYRVHLGDLFDNPGMSVFDQDPNYKRDTQEEIDKVVQYLNRLHVASPKTETVIIFGNHDYGRLERLKSERPNGLKNLRSLELPKLIEESSREQNLPLGKISYHKEWRLANSITFLHGDERMDKRLKGGATGPRRTAEMYPGDDHLVMGHRHRMLYGRDNWKDREVHHVAAMLDTKKVHYNTFSQYENGFMVIKYVPQARPKPTVFFQNCLLKNGEMYIDGRGWKP